MRTARPGGLWWLSGVGDADIFDGPAGCIFCCVGLLGCTGRGGHLLLACWLPAPDCFRPGGRFLAGRERHGHYGSVGYPKRSRVRLAQTAAHSFGPNGQMPSLMGGSRCCRRRLPPRARWRRAGQTRGKTPCRRGPRVCRRGPGHAARGDRRGRSGWRAADRDRTPNGVHPGTGEADLAGRRSAAGLIGPSGYIAGTPGFVTGRE